MHTLILRSENITEGKATEEILNACRANESRESRGRVTFVKMGDKVIALLSSGVCGTSLASAIVDEFDR